MDEAVEPTGGGKKGVLDLGRQRLEMAIDALSTTRETELQDLKFAAGSSDNNFQWPTEVQQSRLTDDGGRPMLTINKLPQHIKQVTNDALQNPLAGKVVPSDGQGNAEVAEIYQGVIRQIESDSDADVAISTANENQVTFGEGYWRILTEFVDKNSFDQKIVYKRIRNSFSVYMDTMAQDPVGRDQEWCWLIEDISKKEYEQKYPKATPISRLTDLGIGNRSLASWMTESTIRIGEYFYIHVEMDTLNLYPGGNTAWKGSPEDKQLAMVYGKPVRTRESEKTRQIKWMKTNGVDVLEESDWAGEWIPVIRVLGNEFEIDGEVSYSGIVRNAKDAQRRYNYLASAEIEMIALAPKAPFIGYAGQFEGYEDEWKNANVKNYPYLQINTDVIDGEGRVLPLPQRAMPAQPQSGIIAAKEAASQEIKETTGQYNASLGQTSNERTGRAILARQAEGDKSTYHYLSNLSRAIRHTTRILIDLIPKIYDTARVIQVMGEDGSSKPVRIDPEQEEAVREEINPITQVVEKIYNPNVGKYGVVPMSGPSYATKRQEAADAMSKIIQTNPQLMGVAGDILVENMDWPGSQKLAKRLSKTIPPELMSDDDPALQQANKKIEELQQHLEQAMGMLQNVEKSQESRELEIREIEVQIKMFDAETKRLQVMQAGLTEEQVYEIASGTVDAALHTQRELTHQQMAGPAQPEQAMPQQPPPQMPPTMPQGMPQEQMMQEPQAPPPMM